MKMLRNVKVNSSWYVWDYDNHAGRLRRMVRRYLSTVVTTTQMSPRWRSVIVCAMEIDETTPASDAAK